MPPKYRGFLGTVQIIALIVFIPFTHLAYAKTLQESSVEIGGEEFRFIAIPPGTFRMGFDSGDGDKRPFHEVTINYRFDMSATEVTDQQFRASIDATGYETDARRCGGAMHCTSLFNRNILLERISYYYRMETLL